MSEIILNLFYTSNFAFIMLGLISFATLYIASFASYYLQGDIKKKRFFTLFTILILSSIIMVFANHLLLLLCSWIISSLSLIELMTHKKEWNEAKFSGKIMRQNFYINLLLIIVLFFTLYTCTNSMYINNIITFKFNSQETTCITFLLILISIKQFGLLSFHKWFISAFNSPITSSSLMHSGINNIAFILLVKLFAIYSQNPFLSTIMFTIGLLGFFIGTICKFIQTDFNKITAFSTIGNMSIILMQFGLGLASNAIIHFCLHAVFKIYKTLISHSLEHNEPIHTSHSINKNIFLLSIFCAFIPVLTIVHSNNFNNTTIYILLLYFIIGAQMTIKTLLIRNSINALIVSCFITNAIGFMYNILLNKTESFLDKSIKSIPQELNLMHYFGIFTLIFCWIIFTFRNYYFSKYSSTNWFLRFYVFISNITQADSKTITKHRNHYKFI